MNLNRLFLLLTLANSLIVCMERPYMQDEAIAIQALIMLHGNCEIYHKPVDPEPLCLECFKQKNLVCEINDRIYKICRDKADNSSQTTTQKK